MIGIGRRRGLNPTALFPVPYVLVSTYVCIGFCKDLGLQLFFCHADGTILYADSINHLPHHGAN